MGLGSVSRAGRGSCSRVWSAIGFSNIFYIDEYLILPSIGGDL